MRTLYKPSEGYFISCTKSEIRDKFLKFVFESKDYEQITITMFVNMSDYVQEFSEPGNGSLRVLEKGEFIVFTSLKFDFDFEYFASQITSNMVSFMNNPKEKHPFIDEIDSVMYNLWRSDSKKCLDQNTVKAIFEFF